MIKKRSYKILALLLVLSLIPVLPGCVSQKERPIETPEAFLEKVDGIWGHKRDDGFWEVLDFKYGRVSDYTYTGHIWVSEGVIDSVERVSPDTLKVVVSHQEILYGEPSGMEGEMLEATYFFKTNDNYNRSLIAESNGLEMRYIYLGRTQEEAERFLL